jgi:peptide/nickel transport system ATP-binding protein
LQTRPDETPLVSVRGLKTYYSIRGSFGDRLIGREAGSVRAVDDVSFDLWKGEVLGLVGESGSGKTTLGRTLLGLVRATDGSVMFEGRDITKLSERELRDHRRRMQIVFQDPHASLNPAMTIGQAVGHPLEIHGLAKGRDAVRRRVAQALEIVGLSPADQFLDKYPSDLSGGQKQRAVIARAVILNPVLLVADEPVSMLDMSVRAKILELMVSLKRDFDLTYLYITHDPGDREVLLRPDRDHVPRANRRDRALSRDLRGAEAPYTQALLRAIPEPDPLRTVAARPAARRGAGRRPPAARLLRSTRVARAPSRSAVGRPRSPRPARGALGESRGGGVRGRAAALRRSRLAGASNGSAVRVPARGRRDRRRPARDPRAGARGQSRRSVSGRASERCTRGADALEIEWNESREPRLVPSGPVEVECHLYD